MWLGVRVLGAICFRNYERTALAVRSCFVAPSPLDFRRIDSVVLRPRRACLRYARAFGEDGPQTILIVLRPKLHGAVRRSADFARVQSTQDCTQLIGARETPHEPSSNDEP